MRVVQTVFGVFHHFELARELQRRHHLEAIFSTWPWFRLKREGLPHEKVRTFPALHMADMLLARTPFHVRKLSDVLGYANAITFDNWTARQLRKGPPIDALIGISGSSLKAGRELQARGGVFLCDRGSSHQRYQERLMIEESARWGVQEGSFDDRDTRREEELYAMADAITVPSTFSARSFVEMGVPREKLHILPYGVRLESFHRTVAPVDIRQRFEVMFAGEVSLRKGIPYLLEAFQKVRHPNKRLRIMGTIQPTFKPLLARLPQDSVELLGSVPPSTLATIMSSCHVSVLPSVEDGFGLVMGQAMACGCPVLASTHTGAENLFEDGKEGFIVPPRDVPALTDRMQRLVDEPDLQARMSEAAITRTQSIGGWTQYGDQWEALLHSLTGK